MKPLLWLIIAICIFFLIGCGADSRDCEELGGRTTVRIYPASPDEPQPVLPAVVCQL